MSGHDGRWLRRMLFGLFFFSGATGLVYELVWVRALVLEFGATTPAVATVLTVFMGGLAAGAFLTGRRADSWGRPLRAYALFELLLGIYAAGTPAIFAWLFPLLTQIAARAGEGLAGVSMVRFLAATLVLAPPTILMGATLPALARFHACRFGAAAYGAGLLYGVNTVGAFLGTLAAGLFLLPALGSVTTTLVAAATSLALAAVAGLLSTRCEGGPTPARAAESTSLRHPASLGQTWLLTAVALSGFAAMAAEVVWTRVLALVLGGSTYAFTIVLANFLAGLGLGGAIVAIVLRAAPRMARAVFVVLALMAAFLCAASSHAFERLPVLFLTCYRSWNLEANPQYILGVQFLIASAVMFLPTLVMGGLFPAACQAVMEEGRAAAVVGSLYAWNTCGAILGSFAAGFVLITLAGVQWTFLTIVGLECLAALAATLGPAANARLPRPSLRWAAVGTTCLAGLAVAPWQSQLMTSGVYIYAGDYAESSTRSLMQRLRRQEELLFYWDGFSATVTVTRDNESTDRDLYISTNGKIDGSSHYDMPTQRLSAHVPMLFHPDPREVCVIGLGTGVTAGSASLHPDSRVTVVEIETGIVAGARLFHEHNHGVLDNPRVDVRIADGRLFLRHHRGKFDVVISEPSNPWLAGTADLFTREFFSLGAQALTPGGLFCQWTQIYNLSPENFQVILRTFTSVFPTTYIVSAIRESDVLLLGSLQPFPLDVARAEARLRQPAIAADLADRRVRIRSIADLLARFRVDPEGIVRLAGTGALHTDDLPIIAYRAPMELYRQTREANMALLADHATGVPERLIGLPTAPGARLDFFRRLAVAYRLFSPGGKEADVCERLIRTLATRKDEG